jgi:16S rRNA (cytidine1402-2'-O)-methyltransferase
MGRQKSQPTSAKAQGPTALRRDAGTLFIVGTPIGFPDDLSIRARAVLGRVSIVAAETPVATHELLAHHGISATITSYGRGDEQKVAVLLDRLKAGHDVALVSDSGMPVIYDPGRRLIAAAHASGCRVTVVPGPSAVVAAAALSGYAADRLLFVGRLPQAERRLNHFFATLEREAGTTIMFIQRPALPRVLRSIHRILPNRAVTLAVNMTRTDERLYQGRAKALLEEVRTLPQDVEVTLVISGARQSSKVIRPGG